MHITNGEARRDDGTLAGSIGLLRDSLVRVRALGVEMLDALRAVTSRPAALVGCHDLASLRPGQPADLLILDEELVIRRRVVRGEVHPYG